MCCIPNTIMTTSDTALRKIYLSLYLKVCLWEGVGERTAIYWPPLLWPSAFLSHSPGLLNPGPGAQPLWVIVFSTASYLQLVWSPNRLIGAWGLPLLGAGFLYRVLSPSDWISWALSYIIVQRLPSSCGRHKLHSFNPYTVKVILCYSSTGCTCYLHRCISYFDSPAGS